TNRRRATSPGAREPDMPDSRTVRWQKITLGTLFVGYAGYYVCRSNLSVVTPLLLRDFGDQGISKEDLGAVASFGVLLYALGKISNGLLADFLGGRLLFLLGMVLSVVCTILFGLGTASFFLPWSGRLTATFSPWDG